MAYLTKSPFETSFKLYFNPKQSTIMHIDLNSCFATIEQQANPKLRGKPIAVAAYPTGSGCILAPSVEAKRYGVKTGMRVKDGRLLCPDLIVLPSDPWKYRSVHLKLKQLITNYTDKFTPKSIDEFVLELEGFPAFARGMHIIGREIKTRIKKEIGDWLTVSIGMAPNRFLAKTAAGLQKPDGLDEINKDNYLDIYAKLNLTDLCGIARQNCARLCSFGIYTVLDFYRADIRTLKAVFHSVVGYDWHLRLRGWEIDDVCFARRSYGNSYALPKPLTTPKELSPILAKLVTKMGSRLRGAGYCARGVHVALSFRDGSFWHKGVTFEKALFDSRDIYKKAFIILGVCPFEKPVRELAVASFCLMNLDTTQLELFDDIEKRMKVVDAADAVNEHWGDFVVVPARMLGTEGAVPDRIAFGGVKELEEFTLN